MSLVEIVADGIHLAIERQNGVVNDALIPEGKGVSHWTVETHGSTQESVTLLVTFGLSGGEE